MTPLNKKILLAPNEFAKDELKSVAILAEYGCVVIPEFYNPGSIKLLNEEFDQLLNANASFIKKIDYSNGKAVILTSKEIDADKFAVTSETYSAPFMDRLTEAYFKKKIKSNTTIFVVNDIVGTRHMANDLHFDVKRSLKYFIYLTDTLAENGAFFCVPGSVNATKKLREKYGDAINYENVSLSRDLPFKDEDAIPLEGKAGTLIVFDTDVFHKAGTVHKGERRVMRGQSDYFQFEQKRPSLFSRILKKITK